MRIKKLLKRMGIGILVFLLLCVVGLTLFINFSPEFGGKASKAQLAEYAKSGHFKDGKFFNTEETNMDMDYGKVLRLWFKKVPNKNPSKDIAVEKLTSKDLIAVDSIAKLTWFGHSAFLLQLEGKHILIDPMLGETPSPHPWVGAKRYSKELPLAIEELPQIDAVILSHDHYDHLDYGSIQKLKDKVAVFYAPLGVGNHLISWGVEKNKVVEMNWWQEVQLEDIQLVCTPARHFSGRGITDRFSTLWSSWVILGKKQRIFFSGDGGYGEHFKEIGSKYAPFDIALMECGQYNENWASIHMMPEETALAGVDVQAKSIMPIHWGAFTLALHSWTDPVERVSKKAQELNLPLVTPKIGESFQVGTTSFPQEKWWEVY